MSILLPCQGADDEGRPCDAMLATEGVDYVYAVTPYCEVCCKRITLWQANVLHDGIDLDKAALSPIASIRCMAARCATAESSVLSDLASDSDEHVRIAVATRPGAITPQIMQHLSEDDSRHVRSAIARRGDVAANILSSLLEEGTAAALHVAESAKDRGALRMLASHESSQVRCRVAQNPSTPGSVLTLLGNDLDLSVLRSVAGTKATLPRTLVQLADIGDDEIDAELARNIRTPDTALELLGSHSLMSVRLAVAQHPNTSGNTLHSLTLEAPGAAHTDQLACDSPTKEAQVDDASAGSSADVAELAVAVSGHKNTTSEDLVALACRWGTQDKNILFNALNGRNLQTADLENIYDAVSNGITWRDGTIRASMARQPAVSPWMLRRFAGDNHRDVRETAAGHIAASVDCLRSMCPDKSDQVNAVLAGNPNTPSDCLDILSETSNEKTRKQLACNLVTSADALRRISVSTSASTLMKIVDHPAVKRSTLTLLMLHDNAAVRDHVVAKMSELPAAQNGDR